MQKLFENFRIFLNEAGNPDSNDDNEPDPKEVAKALERSTIEDAIQNASYNSAQSSQHRWSPRQPIIDYNFDARIGVWKYTASIPDGTNNADNWPVISSKKGEDIDSFLVRVQGPHQLNLGLSQNEQLSKNLQSCIKEEKSLSDKQLEELRTIKDELDAASKMHKKQSERIDNIIKNLIEEELKTVIKEFYEVAALDENEEYCPQCKHIEEKKKKKRKKPCKKAKGKKFVKRVDGRCRSFGQSGRAKGGGPRIRPGTAKGDAYCARSAGIKKCKNPPCANTLSRKKWRCRGKKSMKA